jgi:protease I
MNCDKLRQDKNAVAFVRDFAQMHRPLGAIGHAPWMLIEAGVIRNVTMTSGPSLRTDLINAGANWVDQEAVTLGTLITSRNPDDIVAFTRAITKAILHPVQQFAKAS